MEQVEAKILYELLMNEDLRYYINELEPDYFQTYRNYYLKMVSLFKEGKLQMLEMIQYDPVVTSELQDKMAIGTTFEYCVEQLKDNYNRQELFKQLNYSLEKLKNGKSANDVISELATKTEDLFSDEEPKNQDQIVLDFVDYLEDRIKNKVRYNTGIKSLDNKLGGINPGNLVIVSARAGAGKTTFALQTALNMCKEGHKVLYISLEMDTNEIATKIYSRLGHIDSLEILNNTKNKIAEILKHNEDVLKMNLIIDDKSSYIEEIIYKIKYLRKKGKIDVVFIDYIGLIKMKEKSYSRENEVAKISREFKLLAKDLKIPIIVLAQLNRLAEGQEPTLAMLRDSGSLEQDANKIIFLYQDEDNKSKTVGIVTAKVAKNREGQRGELNLAIDKSCGIITEIYRGGG